MPPRPATRESRRETHAGAEGRRRREKPLARDPSGDGASHDPSPTMLSLAIGLLLILGATLRGVRCRRPSLGSGPQGALGRIDEARGGAKEKTSSSDSGQARDAVLRAHGAADRSRRRSTRSRPRGSSSGGPRWLGGKEADRAGRVSKALALADATSRLPRANKGKGRRCRLGPPERGAQGSGSVAEAGAPCRRGPANRLARPCARALPRPAQRLPRDEPHQRRRPRRRHRTGR